MGVFITPSKPDRMTENWHTDKLVSNKFSSHFNNSAQYNPQTVFNFIQNNDLIEWSWVNRKPDFVKNDDIILIYFSSPVKKIHAVMKVLDLAYFQHRDRPLMAVLEKLAWFNNDIANQLSYENFNKNGMNVGVQNIININDSLRDYIRPIISPFFNSNII